MKNIFIVLGCLIGFTLGSLEFKKYFDQKTNKPRPVYFEPTIVVSPFKLY